MTQGIQSIPRWCRRLVWLSFVVACEPDQLVSMGSDDAGADGGKAASVASSDAGVPSTDDSPATHSGAGASGSMGPAQGSAIEWGGSAGAASVASGTNAGTGNSLGSPSTGGVSLQIPRRVEVTR
jgi:hypothetical protein